MGLVGFGAVVRRRIWHLIALGCVVNLCQRGAGSMGRINKIMTTEPGIRSPEHPVPLVDPRGEIEFRGVSFRYPGTERLVLDDVSFTAAAGQMVAVVGPTGSGKSTLLAPLPRMYDPVEGEILLAGVPLTPSDLMALRRAIGWGPRAPCPRSAPLRPTPARQPPSFRCYPPPASSAALTVPRTTRASARYSH